MGSGASAENSGAMPTVPVNLSVGPAVEGVCPVRASFICGFFQAVMVAMSMTKRYFTSPFSIRS